MDFYKSNINGHYIHFKRFCIMDIMFIFFRVIMLKYTSEITKKKYFQVRNAGNRCVLLMFIVCAIVNTNKMVYVRLVALIRAMAYHWFV